MFKYFRVACCLFIRSITWLWPSFLGACTYDHIGTLAGRYTVCDDAVLLDVYAIGIDLRPQPTLLGLSLGYCHVSYIFDPTTIGSEIHPGSWIFCRIPHPHAVPIANCAMNIGLDMEANPAVAGFQVGFDSTFFSTISLNKDSITYLRFNPRAPRHTIAHRYEYEDPATKILP
jgi:hypothetical protein